MKQFLRDFLYLLNSFNENDPIVKEYKDIINSYKKEHNINFRGITTNTSRFRAALNEYNHNIADVNDRIEQLTDYLDSQNVQYNKTIPSNYADESRVTLSALGRALRFARIGTRTGSDINRLITTLQNKQQDFEDYILNSLKSINDVEQENNIAIQHALNELEREEVREQIKQVDAIKQRKSNLKAQRTFDEKKKNAVIERLKKEKNMPNRYGSIWSQAYQQIGKKLDLGNGVTINTEKVKRKDQVYDEIAGRYKLGTITHLGQGKGSFHAIDTSKYTQPSPPLLGLPLHTEEEKKKIHLNNLKFDTNFHKLGDVEPPDDKKDDKKDEKEKKAELKRQAARGRLAGKGSYQVRSTGSQEAIMLGSPSSGQGSNAVSSFEEQAQREEDSKNRRRFVTDLAIAILAAQKKNPVIDLLKLAVLIMGKHLPILSAALITIAPLIGIFKGARVLNSLRTAIVGGKLAKNAPRAAKLVESFKGSNSLKALFGFGPNSWGSQLTKNIGAQFVNGFKNNGGVRGALSWGTKAIGVNMQSLPWVQKAGGFFGNVTKTTGRIFRHPQWMGAIGGKALGEGALGAGKLALGAGKFALRGLASPIMLGIDALCGFLATQGGKWWQRLAGMLLKMATLGIMSDKKIRQIVGMKEQDVALQQQANNDEERRHREKIGWWDRFWAWLKNILPWAKGDDVTKKGDQANAPTLGAADTDQALKDSIAKKKEELASDKYKVGTKAYNKAIDEFKKEYATKETAGYWASKKSHDKVYKEKLNSEEAQKYAVNKLGTEAKALRNDIKRAETVMNGGAATGGIMSSATGGKYGKGIFAGHNVTSSFGKRNTGIAGASTDHKGIDLDYNYENVGAFAAGKVIFAGQQKDKKTGKLTGYGNYVVVQDAGGMKHTYGHLSRIGVKKGQQIALGQSIGISGNTGTSGGAHLHYGVQDKNNNFLNPLAVSSSSAKDYLEALKASDVAAGTSTMTEVSTKEKEQATSGLREDFAKIVGAQNKNNKQERARNIIFSAVDVTGSLGVWGITQLNNGVMRTGR